VTTGNPPSFGRSIRLVLETVAFLLAALLPASQIGCALPTVRETTRLLPGDSYCSIDAEAPRVLTAAERVVREMDLDILRCDSSGLDGLIVARTRNNGELQVSVKSAGATKSRVWVRVGVFGDSRMQQTVLQRIREQLALSPPTVADSTSR
jgi:hypothetical protein